MNQFNLPEHPEVALRIVQNQGRERELELEAGLVGKFFGTGRNSGNGIAGVVAVLLVIAGLCYAFWPPQGNGLAVLEFWKVITPLITASLGYIFGSSRHL
ncbi:MAG TPA: hypothetical protein VMR31_06265 [Myxococcota bacterium]|nr:hypothetical protein [Myxococcota bacterium]